MFLRSYSVVFFYAVVAFTGEEQEEKGETIAVIPIKWIDKPDDKITDMFWPPKNWPEEGSRPVQLKRAVKNCIKPNIHWPLYKGSILHLYRKFVKYKMLFFSFYSSLNKVLCSNYEMFRFIVFLFYDNCKFKFIL